MRASFEKVFDTPVVTYGEGTPVSNIGTGVPGFNGGTVEFASPR
jgi:hypothetical protein